MKRQVIFILLPVIMLLSACGKSTSSDDGTKAKTTRSDSTTLHAVQNVNKVVGIGLVEPENMITDLAAQLPGTVTKIFKNMGDRVDSGEVIIQMDNREEQLALEKLLKQKQTQQYQIEAAKAGIENTRITLQNAESNLKSAKVLISSGAETKQNLDDLQTKVQSLQADLRQRNADLNVARSQLGALDVDIQKAKLTVSKKEVKAPQDGQILKMNTILNNTVGRNTTLVTFAPEGPVMVRCEIDEMFASQVKPGQKADIRHIGFSKVIATGKVIMVSPYLSQKSLFTSSPTDQQDRRVREVRIELDNTKQLLFNSRVECTIKTK
ncbi:HlyD family secretion protein [Saccharicrinis sp. FJH54]|uniref:HlyD family secretion protein n=1 Tax=Saccharicrinis sp. FJH54 TaxID=3344665 RepID=UPI0035D4E63F